MTRGAIRAGIIPVFLASCSGACAAAAGMVIAVPYGSMVLSWIVITASVMAAEVIHLLTLDFILDYGLNEVIR